MGYFVGWLSINLSIYLSVIFVCLFITYIHVSMFPYFLFPFFHEMFNILYGWFMNWEFPICYLSRCAEEILLALTTLIYLPSH